MALYTEICNLFLKSLENERNWRQSMGKAPEILRLEVEELLGVTSVGRRIPTTHYLPISESLEDISGPFDEPEFFAHSDIVQFAIGIDMPDGAGSMRRAIFACCAQAKDGEILFARWEPYERKVIGRLNSAATTASLICGALRACLEADMMNGPTDLDFEFVAATRG